MCFQTLSSQLLDIKQFRKTRGQESLLPSHSYYSFDINNLGMPLKALLANLYLKRKILENIYLCSDAYRSCARMYI